MGVTYKLKDEIVEFIIQQKKENPLLSCRRLVDVVQERFQTPVSKSSINTVIKNASLSNPVGRTPLGEQKLKKYKIPSEKKILFSVDPSQPKPPKPQTVSQPAPFTPAEPKIKPKAPRPAVPSQVKAGAWLTSADRPLYDCAGSIFLKAAEWEITDKSILGNLLDEHRREAQLTDIDTGCGVLLYLEIFGIKNLDELPGYQKTGLWALNGLKGRVDPGSLNKILQEVRDLKKLSLKISYEIPQIFTHVHALRLSLEDQTSIYTDAELTSFWSAPSLVCPAYVSLNQAIGLVSKQLLNNAQPCIFCSMPGETAMTNEFYAMLAAFENLPGKRIKYIAVLDIQHEEIARFETVPHQKRNFIVGVWPWHKEFEGLLSAATVSGEKMTNVPPFQSKVYYAQVDASGLLADGKHNLRGILLRESPAQAPYLALVTNMKPETWPAEEVVSAYVSKWPNGPVTPYLSFVSGQHKQEQELVPKDFGHLESNLFTLVYGIPGIWEIIHSLLLALNTFTQRHFFPPGYGNLDLSTMKEHFYGLNGYLWTEGDLLCAQLMPSQNYLYKNDLEYAMRRINEKEIRDPQGRRLVFKF